MSLPIPVNIAQSKNTTKPSIYSMGKKRYESTDWLGNVRVTYTDKKSWQQNKFALNVSSSQDYYPFGAVMEGRDLEITNYRFGFQGQEGDDEVYGKNNLWAYKYRLHDARLGRFFSVDPLADKYPYNSVYAFSENRVIDGVELEGLEWKRSQDENGNIIGAEWLGYDKNGEPLKGTVPTVAVANEDGSLTIYTSNKTKQSGQINKLYPNEYGMIELPEPKDVADIYEVYNRTGDDQWGPAKGIAALINAAVDFQEQYPGEKLSFGDMKSPDGNGVKYEKGIHHKGITFQVDMRLLTKKGGAAQGRWDRIRFDPQRTRNLFEIMHKYGFGEVLLYREASQLVENTTVVPDVKKVFEDYLSPSYKFLPEIQIKIRKVDNHKDHYHFQRFKY
ncbi:MAG: hypothetical protein KatS3mg035_2269 [Bacteroidia bacterium]|nr:MAG: hypothetical protein KatS3mg035_2269 [Bacteroidia bacterium]